MTSRPLSARRVYLFAAFALCFVVVLTSLAVSIGDARTRTRPAPGASSEGAIYVQSMTLSTSSLSAPYRLRAQVLIQSDNGPVSRANVTVEVTLPDGSVERDRRLTNSRGLATYSGSVDQPGTYTMEIVSVSKPGATYDAAQNKQTTASVTVGSGSPPPGGGSPTATPTTPPQATATPTTDPGHGNHPPGSCGESTTAWHTPVVNGCATGHEHGDAPPQWVLSAGYQPSFTHPANTPNENSLAHKHTGFKGFTLTDDGVEIYLIMHLDTNPGGHASRFHSYQIWARDASGGVSHWTGWLDFGQGDQTGPNLPRFHCENTDAIRPQIAVNDLACPGGLLFENWYSRAGGSGPWSWDFGFNTSPSYYAGGDPANPSSWTPTGGLNNTRRFEAAWYADRSSQRGTFWATQFGDIVSGPGDAVCGTQRSYGAKSYTILCLEQYIAPTMTSVTFPNNAAQKTYPADGVVLPN